MKPGKADVMKSLTSNVLPNGPNNLFDLLSGIFRSFLLHGDVTLELLTCAFLPLLKGDLKNHLSDSYSRHGKSGDLGYSASRKILQIVDDLNMNIKLFLQKSIYKSKQMSKQVYKVY